MLFAAHLQAEKNQGGLSVMGEAKGDNTIGNWVVLQESTLFSQNPFWGQKQAGPRNVLET